MLRNTSVQRVFGLVLLLFFLSASGLAAGPNGTMHFHRDAVVNSETLANGKNGKSHITSFAVAPDAHLLAVLYEVGGSAPALWLALYDLQAKHTISNIRVEMLDAPPGYYASGITEVVTFTDDGRYLIVRGARSVYVFSEASLALLYATTSHDPSLDLPMFSEANMNTSRLFITYGAPSAVSFGGAYRTEVVDFASGKEIASWSSSGETQSISPNGMLAVAPDWKSYNAGGITNVQVIDARSGSQIKSIPVDFGFKSRSGGETGAITARFLDDDLIVVSPDGRIDSTGHSSGNNLKIISINSGQAVRTITPDHFGPTGELIVSPDRKYFAAVSEYATAKVRRADGRLPNEYKPEIVIADAGHDAPVGVISGLDNYGVNSDQLMPSVSSRASVLAVAQNEAIEIFREVQ